MKKTVVLLPIIMLLHSCARLTEYYYLSFADIKDIQITAYDIDWIERPYNHQPMPIKFQLQRQAYTIYIDKDFNTYWPYVIIQVVNHSNQKLKLIPIENIYTSGRTKVRFCGYVDYEYDFRDDDNLLYGWSNYRSACKNETIYANTLIEFYVLDTNDRVITKEQLPFTVIRNGTVRYVDAL